MSIFTFSRHSGPSFANRSSAMCSSARCPLLLKSLLRRKNNCNMRTNIYSGFLLRPEPQILKVSYPFFELASKIYTSHTKLTSRATFRTERSFTDLGATQSQTQAVLEEDAEVEVMMSVEEGIPRDCRLTTVELAEPLRADALQALKAALQDPHSVAGGVTLPVPLTYVELSVTLCGDKYIQALNKQWRGKDSPTDVLSFCQLTAQVVHNKEKKVKNKKKNHKKVKKLKTKSKSKALAQAPVFLPMPGVLMLGDLVISLETAERQAKERGHSLLTEVRVLLVHGLLHLLGHDHVEGEEAEDGEADAGGEAMRQQENRLLERLGWEGSGLITLASDGEPGAKSPDREHLKNCIKALALDLDGTLLNSSVAVSPECARAVQAAQASGVMVFLATGKSRAAAIRACSAAGLGGASGVVSKHAPGVFLQGLNVYGNGGKLIHQASLSQDVVREAFEYSLKENVPLCAFSADRCLTLFPHPRLDELHLKYLEPEAEVLPFIDAFKYLIINKLIFLEDPEIIQSSLRPHWQFCLSKRACLTQAVPDMLEILPPGASKGAGVKMLLESFGIPLNEVMAIGDGENDNEMLSMSGISVAMGNAVPETIAISNYQVASNDENGVAEAIKRFILDPIKLKN